MPALIIALGMLPFGSRLSIIITYERPSEISFIKNADIRISHLVKSFFRGTDSTSIDLAKYINYSYKQLGRFHPKEQFF